MISVHEAADVDDKVLAIAEEVEEWFVGEHLIEWEVFWDRLESAGVFVGDMSSPAADKIRRHVREVRADG